MTINSPEELNEKQRVAVQRLAKFLKVASKDPEPILKMLDRLGIRWERQYINDVPCIIIKESELEEGEKKHQEAGSLMNQFYGEEISKTSESASKEITEFLKGV